MSYQMEPAFRKYFALPEGRTFRYNGFLPQLTLTALLPLAALAVDRAVLQTLSLFSEIPNNDMQLRSSKTTHTRSHAWIVDHVGQPALILQPSRKARGKIACKISQ